MTIRDLPTAVPPVAPSAAPMLVVGETWTGLIQHSVPMCAAAVVELLASEPGRRVRAWERPIARAVSPEAVTGVDCRLPTGAEGRRLRGIGSVLSRTGIVDGRIVQGSAYARIVRASADYRLPWAHYLVHPGTVETMGKADRRTLVDGFFAASESTRSLDLGAVARRRIAAVQNSPLLDRRAPLLTARTRVRWAALCPGDADPPVLSARFAVTGAENRTLDLEASGIGDPAEIAAFCEDLARHDWLLTVLATVVARIGELRDGARLRAAAEHLLHLWMPGADTTPATQPLWDGFERDPGFTRQWSNLEARVHRTIAARTFALAERPPAEPQSR